MSSCSEEYKRKLKTPGKADWVMDLELKDEKGKTCCIVYGNFQMRKVQAGAVK